MTCSGQNAGPGPRPGSGSALGSASGSGCLLLFQFLSSNCPVLLFSNDWHLSYIYGREKKNKKLRDLREAMKALKGHTSFSAFGIAWFNNSTLFV